MTYETLLNHTLTANSTGWEGQTRVQVIPASIVGAANKIRLTLTGASTKPMGVLSMYVGERGSDAYDFFATPVQVLVGGNGGTAGTLAGAKGGDGWIEVTEYISI